MGVYIDDIDKPKECFKCPVFDYDYGCPLVLDKKQCPLIEIDLIRCGECKFMSEHYDTDGNAPYWTCSEWDSGTDYDGFCHYGERKE